MIRRLMGRLLGFRGEIECLQARVTELSWDETFGMLTRNAFLQYCAELPPGGRSIIFLDLSDIGNLNNLYGFAEVDRRVRSIFAGLEIPGVTIARWYSGDEIVLLFDGSQDPKKMDNKATLDSPTGRNFICLRSWPMGSG